MYSVTVHGGGWVGAAVVFMLSVSAAVESECMLCMCVRALLQISFYIFILQCLNVSFIVGSACMSAHLHISLFEFVSFVLFHYCVCVCGLVLCMSSP